MNFKALRYFISVLLIFFSVISWGAQIKAIKGKKALVDMQSDSFKVGDILKIEGKGGKSVGLIKVTKVKGKFAEGLLKGKAEKGFVVTLKTAKAASKPKKDPKKEKAENLATESSEPSGNVGNYWGLMVGYNSTNADMKTTGNVNVKLKGSGFSGMAFFDYALMKALNVRVLGGVEQFNVSSSDTCAGKECDAKITYLALDAWGRYLFSQGDMRPWIGAGFYLLFPLSKSSSALQSSSITNTNVFAFGGGLDISMGNNSMVPIQVEYDLYPSSDTVKANAIAIRAGYAWSF